MNIVLFMSSILLPTVVGYILVGGEEILSRTEKLVFSFSIGTGLLSFYLFGLVLLGVSFSMLHILPFFIPFVMIGSFRHKELLKTFHVPLRTPLVFGLSAGQKIVFSILAGFLIWKLIFIVFMICSGPTVFNDAFTAWNYKAKVIYYAYAANVSGTGEGVFKGPFNSYPLHLPIMRAWIACFMGRWDDTFVNLHSFVLFLCILGLVFGFLNKKIGGMLAIVYTSALSVIPILVYNVISGYADMAVGYFFLSAAVMLFYWHETGKARFLVFAGILMSVAMFTKNEGTGIVFPALFLTFLFHLFFASRRSWKQAVGYMGVFVISSALIVFWLKESHALSTFIWMLDVTNPVIRFHPEGLEPLMQHLFVFRSFNLFWFGTIIVFLLKWRSALRPLARFFLIPAVLSLCAVLFIFLFTPNITWLMDGTTINRTMLVVLPLLTLANGLLFAEGGSSDVRKIKT